jgi:tetratricopeptide (TPR) repeat protein
MAVRKLFRTSLAAVVWHCVAVAGYPQDLTHVPAGALRADPKTASISGRVVLPTGSSADFNVKVTLSNSQSPLTTFYTNKHGEFSFLNLPEGTYYIEASGDVRVYESVTERVRVARGQVVNLTIALRAKEEAVRKKPTSGVVSAGEYDPRIPAAARRQYERATKSVAKGRLEEAVVYLKQAITIYPDYQVARNDLGVQYLKLKRLDEAAEQFLAVIEINPKYFNSRLNLGLVLIEQRRYREAVLQINYAISVDSSRAVAHLWLGIALLQTDDLQESERELTRALIMGGREFSIAHYYLAHVYLRRGTRDEAARELRVYLAESPAGEYASEARALLERLRSRAL